MAFKSISLISLLILSSVFTKAQTSDKQIFTYVEQMPEFKGDISQYFSENIHYPKDAQIAQIEGRVIVRFVVNEDGSISDVTVVRSVDPSLDKEAIKLVRNMPPWKPGKTGGKPIKVWFTLPIVFKLKDSK